ncbi:MAG TPA: TorF family putative porin [Burkholderiaceae bacterium]
MNKSLLALASTLAVAALPQLAAAQTAAAPAAAEPLGALSFNVSVTSDYRYRGISQSRLKPAIQGGVDYAFTNGFYVGAWASSIKWIKDAGGNADVEVDVYGGYKGALTSTLSYDVGVLTYQYPGHDLSVSPNTTEIYGALTYGPATLKYSHSVTNLFGFSDSKGSGYIDLTASFDVGGGFFLAPHVGYQKVRNNSGADYTDASLTLSKEVVPGLTVALAGYANDTKGSTYVASGGKYLGRKGVALSAKYVF